MKRNKPEQMKLQKLFLLIILTFTLSQLVAKPMVSRVEPGFWWVGMNNPELQILLYGEKINQLQPSVNYKGVELRTVVTVSNPNYLFLNLIIEKDCQPGKFMISLKKKNKLIESVPFELKPRESGSAQREGFNSSDAIYLITPDRFANGNTNNDNMPGMLEIADRTNPKGRHGGDITGILLQLDYIYKLGFTAIWLNPMMENNMPKTSYHGYAITDFYKTDPRFGTNEDYKNLCNEASKKGIKIIMDMVMNHCGSEHWFVKDPPTSDWINYKGQYVNSNHRRETVQDIYASAYDKKKFSDGWFVKSMPDFNQRNELLATYLIQNSIWWIEYAGLGGIRMDTYPYPDKDFMTRWSCAIMHEYPDFNIVGEEWSPNPAIVSYWQAGKINHDGYTSCLPSLMDFPIQVSLQKALTEKESFEGGLARLYKTLALDFLYPDPNNLVLLADNHDMDRFYTQVGQDVDLFKMGMAYLLTMRGIPQIFYGTEILMDNTGFENNHSIIRTDFPGGWLYDKSNANSGQGLDMKQVEVQADLRYLLNWRKEKEVIHSGKLMQFAPENGTYIYFRYNNQERVMVILNKNKSITPLPLAPYAEMIDGYTIGVDVISMQDFLLNDTIQLPAKSALILELNNQ